MRDLDQIKQDENSVIRVLMVVRWPVGGIRTFLKYVLTNFPKRRCDFHVIGIDTEGIADLQSDLGSMIKSWILVPAGGKEFQSLAVSVFKFLATTKIDLVHAHGFSSAIASVPAIRLFRKPMILTSHDVLNPEQFSGFRGRLKRSALSVALAHCKVVQSVSNDAQSNLLSFFPRHSPKCIVINNGIDICQFVSTHPVDIRRTLGLSREYILIGFFGRFMAQKGFRFLVDAIEILKNNHREKKFHVICFGSGAFVREEKAEITRRGLQEDFTFVPFVADVSGAMKSCDLIVMPSRWEACGLVAMESLVSGVPFVGSECIGLREVINGTPAVQVRVADSESLAEGILCCVEKGRAVFEDYAPIAAEKFDVRRTSSAIYSMYKRVLA